MAASFCSEVSLISLLWSCPFIRNLWLWYGTNSRKYVFLGTIEWSIFCGYGLLRWCFFFLYLLTAVVVTAAWRGNNCLVLSTASLCLGGIRDLVLLRIEESAVLHWIVCSIANWFFCLLISIIQSSVKITGFILGEHRHFLSMIDTSLVKNIHIIMTIFTSVLQYFVNTFLVVPVYFTQIFILGNALFYF